MATIRSLGRELSYQPMPLYRDTNNARSVKLDLNSLCIRRPKETFFIQVKNQHLIAWGINLDDLLIVEESDQYLVNDLLVLEKQGEYKFYQFFNEIEDANGTREKILFSLEAIEPNLRITDWNEVKVSGVITNVVHQVRQSVFANLKRDERRYAA